MASDSWGWAPSSKKKISEHPIISFTLERCLIFLSFSSGLRRRIHLKLLLLLTANINIVPYDVVVLNGCIINELEYANDNE